MIMISKKAAVSCVLLLLHTFVFSDRLFAQESEGNAIVVKVKGAAECIGLKAVKLRSGSLIHAKDSIYLPVGSDMTVLGEDGSVIYYESSFRLTIPGEKNELVHQLMRQNLKHAEWLASVKKKPKNNFRAHSDKDMFMLFPRNTKLTDSPHRLTWKASKDLDTKFEVSMRCYENDFTYDELTRNESIELGSSVSIVPDKQYYWFVREANTELSEMPPAVWFSILSGKDIEKFTSEKKTLASILAQDTLSVAFQLLYANLLISYELYDESRRVLDAVSSIEPHNPVVHTFYAVVFDKMDMLRESQKYIEYSDQMDQ